MILHSSDPSSPLRFQLAVTADFYALFFKPKTWNDMVRHSLTVAGSKWIVDYLPLRFTLYAAAELGYDETGASKYSAKQNASSGKLPLVSYPDTGHSGRLREYALSQSWADAVSTSHHASLTLHIQTGSMISSKNRKRSDSGMSYTANPVVYQVLTTITQRELSMIAETTRDTLIALVMGAESTASRKGTVRSTLTPTQRSSLISSSRTHTQTSRRTAA